MVPLHWDLIPSWAKDVRTANRMINARAENVADKPAYRMAFRKRRYLIPANGFYEWRQTESGKHPYHIHMKDGGVFTFAGLWESWAGYDESDGWIRRERITTLLRPYAPAMWPTGSANRSTTRPITMSSVVHR
jgi:putative SOS response-associated peptidase YedK